MNKDELLAYAHKHYPIGTKYIGVKYGNEQIATESPIISSIDLNGVELWVGKDYIYSDGRWAKITPTPSIQPYTPPKPKMRKSNYKYKIGDKVDWGGHIGIVAGMGSISASFDYIFKGYPSGHNGYSEHYLFDENGNGITLPPGNDYYYLNENNLKPYVESSTTPPKPLRKFKYKVGDKVMYQIYEVTITGIEFNNHNESQYRIKGYPNGHEGDFSSYDYDENGKSLASYYDSSNTSYFVEENELAYCWYEPALNRKRKHRYTQYSIGQKVKVECEGKELIGTIEGFEFQNTDSQFQFMNWIRFKGKSHGHDGRSKDYNYNEYGEVFEFKTSSIDYWFLPVENIIKDEEILPIEFKSPPVTSREGEGKACILGTPKGEIVVNFKEIWEKDLSSYKTFKQEYPYYWNTDAVDFGCIDLNPQTKTLPHQSAKVMKVNKGKPKLSIAKK